MIKLQTKLAKEKMLNGDGHNHFKIEIEAKSDKQSKRSLPIALIANVDNSSSMNEAMNGAGYFNHNWHNQQSAVVSGSVVNNPQLHYDFMNGYQKTTAIQNQVTNTYPQQNRNYESKSKMEYVKTSLLEILDALKDDDYFGVVSFDSLARTVVELAKVGGRRAEIKKQILNIQPRGCTNMYDGLRKVEEEFAKLEDKDVLRKTIVLSDGQVNEGIRTLDQFADQAIHLFNKYNVQMSSIGFGADYNLELMSLLANKGEGNFYHLKQAEDIYKINEQELSMINSVVAHNVELSVTVPVGFTFDENMNNFSETYDGNVIKIKLGNLYADKFVIFPIHLLKQLDASEVQIPATLKYNENEQEVSITNNTIVVLTNNKEEKIKEDVELVREVTDTIHRISVLNATVEYENSHSYSNSTSYLAENINNLAGAYNYASVDGASYLSNFSQTMDLSKDNVDSLRSLNAKMRNEMKNKTND